MKLLIAFSIVLFLGITAAAPASEDDDKVVITKKFYPDCFIKYRSQHDIVNILVPINSLNFDKNEYSSFEEVADIITLFFVEADVAKNGKRTYQGLYVLKNGKKTKILENGRDAAASADDSKQVFFAADDGLYEYNSDTNEAVKYGSVTDSIIGIGKTNTSDTIYILTEGHELYKVTDAGNTKTKVEEVVNAQEFVLDYLDNIYFYAEDKKPYVLTADGLKSFEGLPSNPRAVKLLKPPVSYQDGVPLIIDNVAYIIYANGTIEDAGFSFKPKAKPTAYAMEATLIQYYAYNKKIYEYNLLAMVTGDIFEEFRSYLQDKTTAIQTLANQKKGNKSKI